MGDSRNRKSDSGLQNLLGKSSVWRFVKGFMIDPCPEKIMTEEPLTFVSTSLAGEKDAFPLSQWNCTNLHQLSFCFFVCVALSAPLPRESKHSLFFPGSKRSQCRRIAVSLSLLVFIFTTSIIHIQMTWTYSAELNACASERTWHWLVDE